MSGISKNIRASVPEFIKKPLRTFLRMKNEIAEYPLIRRQPRLHEKALQIVRKKKVVTVAFFATHSSVWKYDGVYELMAQDPRFDPVVIVCPVVNYGRENMLFEMEKAYNLFASKGLNVKRTYNEQTDTYLDVLKEIEPDIIFYTNPHKGLIKENYYISNFVNTLTCYVQYAFHVSGINQAQYNQLFHNLLWKAYYETEIHKSMAKSYARNKASNVVVTGYPGIDNFVYGKRDGRNVWKEAHKDLKRVIWAPHHTVDMREKLGYSCFLRYYKIMLDLANRFADEIQFVFKPHPLLRMKLYNHQEWGRLKTDRYYEDWDALPNGQVNTNEYVDLFNTSDAMILDSGSFTAEYLACGKPSLFTLSSKSVKDRFNEFGKLALDIHYHANNERDIIEFLESVVCDEKDIKKNERLDFYKKYLVPPNGKSASKNIFDDICWELFNR